MFITDLIAAQFTRCKNHNRKNGE